MSFLDVTRSPASARLMLAFGEEQGLRPDRLLANTGLRLAQLDDPLVEITALQELRVAEQLLRALGPRPGLGMEVGLRYSFSTYGIWGLGLISSATAADALALAMRSMPLAYAFALISFHEVGEQGILSFGEPDVAEPVRRFMVERDMTAAARLLHEVLGRERVLGHFQLRHASRVPAELLDRIEGQFGARPVHGSGANTLAFDRRWLQTALPQANPLTVATCEAVGAEMLARRRARQGLLDLVRAYLQAAPLEHLPDLPRLATLLGLSERTLKRRLHEEGTSFRALIAEIRQQRSMALLADPSLSLSDIAERLGFSDLSSFSQAFKRWFGVSPSQRR